MSESRVDNPGVRGMYGSSLCGKREVDEDFVACGDFGGVSVAVLCDGMGGAESGDVSSKIAARGFVKAVGSLHAKGAKNWSSEGWRHKAYGKMVAMCHDAVNRMSGVPGRSGTTLTAVISTFEGTIPSFADIVHIGDSRCYILEDGGARLVTNDHSVTGDMQRAGYIELHEIPETSGNNVLTRNIGDEKRSEAEMLTIDLDSSSKFLLCCDGVWDPLHGRDGLWLPEQPLCSQESADRMTSEAIERGSTDNCSVLIVEIGA